MKTVEFELEGVRLDRIVDKILILNFQNMPTLDLIFLINYMDFSSILFHYILYKSD